MIALQNRIEPGFGFFVALSAFLLLDRSGLGAMCVAAALLHELGHLAAMALFRVKVVRVRLRTLEVGIERNPAPSLCSELLIDLAGPAANLLLAAASYASGNLAFSAVNCALGLFELCPLPSLDGGQALFVLAQRLFSLERARWLCGAVVAVVLLGVLGAGIFLAVRDKNFTLFLLLVVLSAALCPAKKRGKR